MTIRFMMWTTAKGFTTSAHTGGGAPSPRGVTGVRCEAAATMFEFLYGVFSSIVLYQFFLHNDGACNSVLLASVP